MKISKLIAELQYHLEKHGDIEVGALGPDGHQVTHIFTTTEPYYYDGGCLVYDETKNNWMRSKFHPELGQAYCYIVGIDPNMGIDCDEYFEGHLIPHIGDGWDEEKVKANKELFKQIYSNRKPA